jgi:hypothetical protein
MRRFYFIVCVLSAACASSPVSRNERWWKGNLHAHSLWSDGKDFPEMIAAWYKDHGYHFLSLTEHDLLQGGNRWVDINAPDAGWPPRNASARTALPRYRARFGQAWVQEHVDSSRHLVRLRPLSEYRHLFEELNRFAFIVGEEITDRAGAHTNAFNLNAAILPRGGATNAERIRNNLAAVAEARRASTRPILAIVNHPNYVWALKAEDLAAIPDARLFEVYNGHQLVNNAGDSAHISTERMWDVILTMRHEKRGPPIFGVATDDAHEYHMPDEGISMPGRGWVMVRSERLTPDHLLAALDAGDFYASTGVTLRELHRDAKRITIEIEPEAGVTYITRFIGTRSHSNDVGAILAEVPGLLPDYRFKGDERYVRAIVTSSKRHVDPLTGNLLDFEKAWIQPVMR